VVTQLIVRGLNAGYGKLQVLFDVNMEARKGDITVIVGPNGSGKSTLLKTIFGLTTIYSGTIQLNGEEITKLKPHQIARLGVAYLPQVENVFANLTVRENLMMAGYTLQREEIPSRVEEVLEVFPVLKSYLARKAKMLSGGERQMLAMAMALMRKPVLMMFDEPTAGMAPKLIASTLNKIVELRDTLGITILLVEQNAKKALEIGDTAHLLVAGRSIYSGPAQQLLSHPELSQLYLGLTAES